MTLTLRRLSASEVVLRVAKSLSGFFFKCAQLLHFDSFLIKQWDRETFHKLFYIYGCSDQILRSNKDHMIFFFIQKSYTAEWEFKQVTSFLQINNRE